MEVKTKQMNKNKYYFLFLLNFISINLYSQVSEFDVSIIRGDSSMINKIYKFIEEDSPNCIKNEKNENFNIYFKSISEKIVLKIFIDDNFISNYTTYIDLNFPNLILSIENKMIGHDTKIKIFYEEKKIEFIIDKENKSVLITPSFDVYLVDIKDNNKEGEKINFEKKYTKVKDGVVVECFNFDYVYEYIPTYNCFKRTGRKLFHR
jgi:hypothetical protein